MMINMSGIHKHKHKHKYLYYLLIYFVNNIKITIVI
jgi:hypothetical protein